MTSADIERVIAAFAQAASRALRAGFRMLELHAAHGYLLHSFLSPISNRRTDAYGGTLQNRIRIVVECVRAVRTAWPSELPLSVRVSATDWIAGGWELDDTVHLARTLAAEGVDIVDCSTGGSGREQDVRAFPGYQLAFAETVRKRAGIPTAGVGLLSDPHMIEQMLQRRQADMAVLGRALLWDPYWTHHAASSLGVEPALPIQYARSATHAPRSRVRAAPQRLAHP
jgi:2,4-dienoyl-CoA reductase-like NADH-dependent reductase (Old Yellow Enzyme family)